MSAPNVETPTFRDEADVIRKAIRKCIPINTVFGRVILTSIMREVVYALLSRARAAEAELAKIKGTNP